MCASVLLIVTFCRITNAYMISHHIIYHIMNYSESVCLQDTFQSQKYFKKKQCDIYKNTD